MTTTILPSMGLASLLTGKILFLDTNVFVGALLCDDLALFLTDLRKNNESQVLTVSSAVYEFTRGSKTLEEFNDKREFVNGLTDRVIPVGPLLENAKNGVAAKRAADSKGRDYTFNYLLREIISTDKAMFQAIVRPHPTVLGDPEPIELD